MEKEVFNKLVQKVTEQPDETTINALEPFRAKRAIFLAAGFGSRMLPITLSIPKPLVKVNGIRIIETMIDACLENDIKEIYIVRGYLAEQFNILLEKYPMIKFIENPDFNTTNNISSAFVARHLLENAYVVEADLLVLNPRIIRKYHYSSDVLGIPVAKSDDWCLLPDEEGNVYEETIGGTNCYQMMGVYYWNQFDAKKLSKDIETTFLSGMEGKNRYWETVPNQVYRGRYRISILPCSKTDIVEIDTIEELKSIDNSYS